MRHIEARLDKIENSVSPNKQAIVLKIDKGILSEAELELLKKQDYAKEADKHILITINSKQKYLDLYVI